MKDNKDDDRRRFFRITDAIGVSYEIIDEKAVTEAPSAEMQEEGISIKLLLEHHNLAIEAALSQVDVKQPEVAKAIGEVNKKLDTLLALFELDDLGASGRYQQFEQASISASGIAFPVGDPLPEGTLLNLSLFLQPSGKEVTAVGKVIGCQSGEDDTHFLRVEFDKISEADRECLIQHIVQRQSTLLKTLREQMEDEEG